MLLVLSIFVAGWAPLPPDDSRGDDTNPPDDTTTYDSTLQILKITAEVDGKADTITSNNKKISKEAKQESDIEFEIEFKNLFDKELKNLEVTVTIKDIDDGDDLDEDFYIGSLNAGDSDKAKLDFELPLQIDDNDYDVEIHIEGKDQDNNLHILSWTLILEVKKDSHNVKITKASLSPSKVLCGRTSNLEVKLLNLGRNEEDVEIEIKSAYLGIDFKEKDIELGTGTDNEAEYEKIFRLSIPNNIEAGTYPISIKAYYDNGKSAAKNINLEIQECAQTKQSSVSIRTLPPTPQETLGELKTKSSSGTTISTIGEESIILLLSIILVIVLGLIIFLLGVIMIKLKR